MLIMISILSLIGRSNNIMPIRTHLMILSIAANSPIEQLTTNNSAPSVYRNIPLMRPLLR